MTWSIALAALSIAIIWARVGEWLVTKPRLVRLVAARGFVRSIIVMALVCGPLGLLGAIAAEVQMWRERR